MRCSSVRITDHGKELSKQLILPMALHLVVQFPSVPWQVLPTSSSTALPLPSPSSSVTLFSQRQCCADIPPNEQNSNLPARFV